MNRKDLDTGLFCPVCGYMLDFKAWHKGNSSQEICPSCGTQFGYDDSSPTVDGVVKNWDELRKKWIANGMKWSSIDNPLNQPSKNWSPVQQLKNIGV